MVWPIMLSLSWRNFVTDLVEEIEDEADLVHRSSLFCARRLQHGEALAVWVQVKVIEAQEVGELAGRPELRLVGAEGGDQGGVSDYHDLAVQRFIKKLLAVARPLGKRTTSGGNLPLAAWAREWPDVNFKVSAIGFVGLIGEPAAIGREGGVLFDESAFHEGFRLSGLPAGLLVAFDGESHDVPIRAGVLLKERQDLAIGPPGAGVLRALTFRKALGIPGTIGAYPPEVKHPALFYGGIDDSLAVRSPHGKFVVLAPKSQAREGIAFPLVHPDVAPFAIIDFQSQPFH